MKMTNRFIKIETEDTDRYICIYHISHYYHYNHDRIVIVMNNGQSFRALDSISNFEDKLTVAFHEKKRSSND